MGRLTRVVRVLGLASLLVASSAVAGTPPDEADIVQAFAKQGIRINQAEARGIRTNFLLPLEEARLHRIGNSKVHFAAVEIAASLGLDTSSGSNTVRNVVAAIRHLAPSAMKLAPNCSPFDTSPKRRRDPSWGSLESPCPEVCETIAPLA